MKSIIVVFLCTGVLLGATSALSVGPVRLANNMKYISYRIDPPANTSLIECMYELQPTEQVDLVFWELWKDDDKVGLYEWQPGVGGEAHGRLKGAVNLSEPGGGLKLTKTLYELAGMYVCGVTLSNGESKKSDKEEILIVDIGGSSTYSSHGLDCGIMSSFQSAAVFPEPTLRGGLYQEDKEEFYKEVAARDWMKFVYSNGSVSYTYSKAKFEIDEKSPEGLTYAVKMGVTKSDGQYISLGSFSSRSPSWDEHGCPDVEEKENTKLLYFPGFNRACRGGRRNTTKATMTCKRRYKPTQPVSPVVMRCNGTTLKWEPEEGLSATFEDLKCVKDEDQGKGNNGESKGAVSSGNLNFILIFLCVLSALLLRLDCTC